MSVDDSLASSSVKERVDYDLFISYSRRDKDFVRQLWEVVTQANQKTWIDWEDIPPITDWRQEIYLGIEAANHFVFILSPHSIASEVCGEELAHALKHSKRLVPIVRQDVDFNRVHPELAKINAIYFRESDDFGSALQKLLTALETDLTHVRTHTRLLVRAREWENKEYDSSFLLRGSELKAAKQWLAQSSSKDPQPTTLHREFIDTSQVAEMKRQEEELRLHRMTPQQSRNRQALLNKVNSYWVKGVLENSLQNRALIALGLEERLDTVAQPWNMTLEKLDQPEKTIPQGTRIIAIFDQLGEGRTLLILGEPGAGKTTTLLELTRDLVNRAEQGIDHRIPVVFNLSSWADEKQTVAEWLVKELNTKYQVPKQVGQDWVKEQQLLLLLDGLDEVKAERRDACIAALNAFQLEHSCEMVVTSRIKDYEALCNRLNFQSAIYVRSLTLAQVRQYLDSAGSDLTGLRALIEEDAVLIELAKSPLMLNIMTLAYQGVAVEDLPKTELVEERRQQLFDGYIERMFKRRVAERQYSKTQVMRWLTWLAQKMSQQSQTVFLIERLQPEWLDKTIYKWIYALISGLTFGSIVGLILGPAIGVIVNPIGELLKKPAISFGVIDGLRSGLLGGFLLGLMFIPLGRQLVKPITGLIFVVMNGLVWLVFWRLKFGWDAGLILGLIGGVAGVLLWVLLRNPINPTEILKWSWIDAKSKLIKGLAWGLCFGMVLGMILGLIDGLRLNITFEDVSEKTLDLINRSIILANRPTIILILGLINAVAFGLIFEGIGGLIGGLIGGMTGTTIETRTVPNQGIRQSAKNAMILALIGAVGLGLAAGLLGFPVLTGVMLGLLFGLFRAGEACFKHLILRLVLYFSGSIPWNYSHFLNYATDRIFLQKVGGGYIFIHRMLLEHFAALR
jgi:DNA polymerase III delta prime subunit